MHVFMKSLFFLIFGVLFGLVTSSALAELRISEFMAENLNVSDDEELNARDWVEIENTGEAALKLDGYFRWGRWSRSPSGGASGHRASGVPAYWWDDHG